MKCFLCNGASEQFLDLERQPLANKYPKKEDFEKEDFFPLTVYFCPTCKNVQLGTAIDRSRMFEDYYYLSSVNPGLVRHFERLAKELSEAKFIVDIGSNDGILLKPLKAMGVKALGVEPSINVSKIANDNGLPTITAFFDAPTVQRIVKEHGKADVVVTSSVFTHLEDPHTFTEDVKRLLTDDGVFLVEVEYIGHILSTVQYERFYLDRIFYYSLTSLQKLFEQHGMYIADVAQVELHGVSLRVFVKKGQGDSTPHVHDLLEKEKQSLALPKLLEFQKHVADVTTMFRETLQAYQKKGLRVVGYGAPARVSTITNYGNIGPDLIAYIVDDSPLKQGRFSPGKHIPIVPNTHLTALVEKPDVLVVFAFEYLDDIKKKTSNARYRYLLPIPPREVD